MTSNIIKKNLIACMLFFVTPLLQRFKIPKRKIRRQTLRLLDPFFPKIKNKYLVVSQRRYGFRCNVRLIAEALTERGKHVYLLYEGEVSDLLLESLNQSNITLLNKVDLTSLYHILTASTLILGHSIKDAYLTHHTPNRKVVNLWHGVPIKAIELALRNDEPEIKKQRVRNSDIYDLMIASSHIDRLAMSSCFGITPNQVTASGLPRYDYLFDKNTDLPKDLQVIEKRLLAQINGKKLILFAPTFRENTQGSVFSPCLINDLVRLERYCRNNNMIMGVRAHIADNAASEQLPKGMLILGPDIISETNLLLKHVNCLITDFSSIWVDYLLLDRPIIGFAKDYNEYLTQDRGFLYPFLDVFPSPFYTEVSDVITHIDRLKLTPNWHVNYQKQKFMFHDDLAPSSSYTHKTLDQLAI